MFWRAPIVSKPVLLYRVCPCPLSLLGPHLIHTFSLTDDAKKLYRDFQVSIRNCVDLSLLARSADNPRWKGKYSNPIGLSRLVEAYEDILLPKGKISRSNWEDVLDSRQIECLFS